MKILNIILAVIFFAGVAPAADPAPHDAAQGDPGQPMHETKNSGSAQKPKTTNKEAANKASGSKKDKSGSKQSFRKPAKDINRPEATPSGDLEPAPVTR